MGRRARRRERQARHDEVVPLRARAELGDGRNPGSVQPGAGPGGSPSVDCFGSGGPLEASAKRAAQSGIQENPMFKAISIVPIFASFVGALAYQTEPEQPRAAATAVLQVAVQVADAGERLIAELGTTSFKIYESSSVYVQADADTQWSDVFEVLEAEVANPDARERLGVLIGELESLAYAGDAGVDGFNAVLELTMEEFWVLNEEDGLLSYAERDLVFDVLMDAITNFPMAEGTTKWVVTETLVGQKCKTPSTATCKDGQPKQTCIKKKEQKKQKDGTYVDTGTVKCESGTV